MTDNLNYISDDELERLICQIEENELVAAPPDLMDSILKAAELMVETENIPPAKVTVVRADSRKKEFYAYCFRVITSVAAAVALVFLLPGLAGRMNVNGMPIPKPVDKSTVVGTVPVQAEVVKSVPDKATVTEIKPTPSKEEVLDATGFFDKVISSTEEWLSKEKTDK